MAAAIFQKEKEPAEKHKQNKSRKAATNPPMATKVRKTPKNQPSVISSPSAPNLNALITGHVRQDRERFPATKPSANDTSMKPQAKDTVKSPTKKKSKKIQSSEDDKAAKRNSSGSVLKKSSFAMSTAASLAPTEEYLHNQVFYKAGLELKGEDTYGVYVKQMWNLLENIRLVDPCAIMHAADGTGGAKPIGSKKQNE